MIRTLRLVALFFLAALTLRVTGTGAASVDSARAPKIAPAETGSVEELIEQLGSEQYFLRRQAEEALVNRGADAFDLLQLAESHPDLEIATSAHYILQQIRIEWTRPEDSADVQAIMHRYGDLSKDERVEKMDDLAALSDDEGLRPLCRIARFEPSSRLARYAALKVLQTKPISDRTAKGGPMILDEVGSSQRTAAEWLRTYAAQLARPNSVLPRWLELVDAEIALVGEDSAETDSAFAFELIDVQLDQASERKDYAAVFEGIKRRTDLYVQTSGRLRDGLLYGMNRLWEKEAWPALALVEDHYADAIREDRLLLYFSAAARWKQDRIAEAEELAERAFALEADDAEDRAEIGDLIGEMGRHDWAEREWWYVLEQFPVLDINALSARRSLASLRLHDRGEDARAAKLMEEIVAAVDADRKIKGNVMREPERRRWFNQFHAQREFFLACQAATQGDFVAQRKHLDAAYGFDPEDADVLIAMYRSPGADEAYHQNAISRARGAAKKVAETIEQDPDNAQSYNHWAWLVSNTEGDFYQAVKYSLRSLDLSPDSPSYLDTLGRCYYSVGDLDNAARAQREAVRRHPHLQVMRDQLRLIESALAEREKD